jgi:hypothetical protein
VAVLNKMKSTTKLSRQQNKYSTIVFKSAQSTVNNILPGFADPGCFISDPESGSEHSSSRNPIRIRKFLHPGSRLLHEKWDGKKFALFFLNPDSWKMHLDAETANK